MSRTSHHEALHMSRESKPNAVVNKFFPGNNHGLDGYVIGMLHLGYSFEMDPYQLRDHGVDHMRLAEGKEFVWPKKKRKKLG